MHAKLTNSNNKKSRHMKILQKRKTVKTLQILQTNEKNDKCMHIKLLHWGKLCKQREQIYILKNASTLNIFKKKKKNCENKANTAIMWTW